MKNMYDAVDDQPCRRLEGGDIADLETVWRYRLNMDGISHPQQWTHTAAGNAEPDSMAPAQRLDIQRVKNS